MREISNFEYITVFLFSVISLILLFRVYTLNNVQSIMDENEDNSTHYKIKTIYLLIAMSCQVFNFIVMILKLSDLLMLINFAVYSTVIILYVLKIKSK